MFKSYVHIALRHLITQKLYSAINIIGLAVGLACFILIAIFVQHELSYDKHYANADRIHRISRGFLPTERTTEMYLATIAPQAAVLLKEDFPQIEKAARISCCGGALGTRDGELFDEPGLATADNELFEIFDFEWLQGDPTKALAEPYTIVLTKSAARRYFGDTDPMGQTLMLDNRNPLEVTGVIEDLRDDTHLQFSALGSLLTTAALLGEEMLNSWSFNSFYTYVLLEADADIKEIQDQSGSFFERHFEQGSSAWTQFTATALTDIHLRSNRENEMRVPGSVATVYTFSVIAVFILLIACINFMNLATARSAQRAKEIGVRKVVGAGRDQVILQFLAESVLLAAIALVLALTLVELALPAFNGFLEMELAFDYFSNPTVALALGLLPLVTGLAAGSYPAFYLSAFEPAHVLKGDVTRGGGTALFRKILVVLQFSISIALLIATAVVYQQMQFARNVELGYDKERIVVVNGSFRTGLGEQWETLKREWLAHPDITHVTASMLTPSMQNTLSIGIAAEGRDPEGGGIPFLWIDYDFFEAYGIEVVAGRTFSEEFGSDRMQPREGRDGRSAGAYIISELAARRFGWTSEEALSKSLELTAQAWTRGPIVGVVEDIYFESVRSSIEPIVYMIPPENEIFGYAPLQRASLRITGRDLENTLAHIDAKWKELVPDQPISRRFLDQDFEALYRSEQRQAQMFTFFSALAIFIACLGLFGLAAFTTERRTKEIGIRKVVGGSIFDIVRLFTADFSKLVLLANVVAWPAAYILMDEWLSTFAYRIDMSPWVYAGSALLALAIAWLTVGAVAARAAATKPIRSLRYE